MRNEESQVQKAICQYLDMRKVFYFAVTNGGKRNKVTASIMKAEGVKAGIPDICIIHEGMVYFLEVKRPASGNLKKGYLSKVQKEKIAELKEAGAEVAVVYSVADVIECCISWGFRK